MLPSKSKNLSKQIPYLLIVFILISFLVCAPLKAQAQQAQWTFLIYLGADCDLEACMLDNLRDIVSVGGSEKVNFVVIADRSPNKDEEKGYSRSDVANIKSWSTAKLLLVLKNKLVELDEWGVQDLGSEEILTRFINYGLEKYPAKKTAIIFSDHGAGWSGVNADEHPNDNMLNLERVTTALQKAKDKFGMFEIIGFDACLMANLEVAQAIAPFGHIMVASEETEPGDGWNFVPVTKYLIDNPQTSGEALGKIIVQTFNDYFEKSSDKETRERGGTITLAVISLDKVNDFSSSVDAMSSALMDYISAGQDMAWNSIAKARSYSTEFGKDSNPAQSYHYFDIGNFAVNLKKYCNNAKVSAAADNVISKLKETVIFAASGKMLPGAAGLSIYFPFSSDELENSEGYSDIYFSRQFRWYKFLEHYSGISGKDIKPIELAPTTLSGNVIEGGQEITVTSSMPDDDYEEAYFVLSRVINGNKLIIGQIPTGPEDNGELNEKWDGGWFALKNKKSSIICPITAYEDLDEKGERYLISVPVMVCFKNSKKWISATLKFEYNEKSEKDYGVLISATTDTKWGRKDIDLNDFNKVVPVYLDEKGKLRETEGDTAGGVLEINASSDLIADYDRVPNGNYSIGFRVIDYSGNSSIDLKSVIVK